MFSTILSITAWSAAALLGSQDDPIQVFGDGEPTPRSSTRVFYWDGAKSAPAGQVSVDYAGAAWKDEWNDAAEFQTVVAGKTSRLGKDSWTRLDTHLPLKAGDRSIAVGEYFLAATCSEDGKAWGLAFIDPAKARAAKLDAFQSDLAPVAFTVPLERSDAEESVATQQMMLTTHANHHEMITFEIHWGKHVWKTQFEADLGG
jgi:hypothetical protein